MPELPEVEHTRRNLVKWMRHARVARVFTTDKRLVRPELPETFVESLTGHTIESIDRRGKWLRFSLGNGEAVDSKRARLFVHLGMSGWFHLAKSPEPMRFERVGFFLLIARGRDRHVAYVDPRRWGRLLFVKRGAADIDSWTELGPDPLEGEIDVEELHAKLARRKRSSIKNALMDQSLIAGIGNIHAMEALWKARIDPRSLARVLDAKQLREILRGLKWTIERALTDLAGDDSRMGTLEDNPFRIYGRKGEPCPRCKTELERIMLAGRSTTFCPGCQVRYYRSKATKKHAKKATTTQASRPAKRRRRGAKRA